MINPIGPVVFRLFYQAQILKNSALCPQSEFVIFYGSHNEQRLFPYIA